MLFFRSGDLAASWCANRGVPRGPLVSMDQLWHLSVTWYGTRLDIDSWRPAPEEMRGIFESIGLEGDFWDPRADTFT